ncbi:helix-turn-helix transcriptional regulator [Paenibacillus sp. SYP-B4298]|uniref:helix-turn-helix transcriptional regulator n=1 Tax=Paenibacillus sp. SYP-B4298 TaxID=2996034 RepID=UPI0022DE6B97|nr:helix-turn-helix transcriptional regulator [Paenibacillus sp. SYP-B4298]
MLWRKNLLFGERTFRRWFISSMCVILLFLLLGLLLYMVGLYATERAVVMAQRQSAEQARTLIDSKLLDIEQSVSALTFNERLVSAAFIEPPLAGSDYYALHKAAEELKGLYLYGNIKDVYVYYSGCACYISSYSLIQDKQGTFTEQRFGMSREAWREFAQGRLTNTFMKAGDMIYYFSPLKRRGAHEVYALAIVALDRKELERLIIGDQEAGDPSASFGYLVDADGELIATTGEAGHLPFAYGTMQQGENFVGHKVVTSQRLTHADWEYISVVPVDQYFKEIYALRPMLYGYLCIGIILAAAVGYIETSRRYRPVLTLRKKFQTGSGKPGSPPESNEDIFLSLQQEISSMVEDNTRLTTLLREEKETIRAKQFSRLLREQLKPEELYPLFADSFGMPYRHGVVVIVHVVSSGRKLQELPIREREHILLICLNNIAKEMLGEAYNCFFWRDAELTGVIWSDQAEEEGADVDIARRLEQARDCIIHYFDADLQLSLSSGCHDASRIPAAYAQAQQTCNYANMTGKTGVICYDSSFTQPHPQWNRSDMIRAEQDFMSYMLEHNYDKAKAKLEMITGYYGYTDGVSIQLLKCRMFGLMNLVLNAIEMRKTPAEEQFYTDMNPIGRLLNASTIRGLEQEIMAIIEEMILHYEEKDESTGKKLEYIDRYIEAHYMDPSLSVQQLADLYQFSVSYLSKVYKRQKGLGVLEAINRCRVHHAKQWLVQQPDMPLAGIAEKVGYGNVQTFIRIFKKQEEQTPGQYRQSVHTQG